MNLKTKGIFLDQNGNEKTFPKGANGRTLSMPCDATDPDFEDNTFNLQSIDVNFQGCNNSFTVTAHYQLSTGFNVVSANPLNSTQLTRGRMRIRQGTSNILYTDNNIAIASSDIVLLGSDPSNPNKKLYSITYTSQPITNTSWLQNTIYFEERPIIYTDCSDAIITPATWQAIPWSFGLNVCNRIDPIQIMPNGSGSIIYFNGVDAAVQYGGASCYPSGVERPTETEVQWNQGGSWATIPFNNAWGCSPSQASNLPSVLTMPYTFTGVTGNVNFRYRNVKRSGATGCGTTVTCSGPWSSTVTVNVQ